MTTTRAIGYIRVSTDKQADLGVSLEAQREQLTMYSKLYGIELVDVVQDVASASTLDRPGLQYALERLRRGDATALVVTKLDRLTRSVVDAGALVDKVFDRAALLSVSEQIDTRSAMGRLVLNIMSSMSQWEREAIGERTRTALAHKRRRGLVAGTVPYGQVRADDDPARVVENPHEQETIAMARELRAKGHSLRNVARLLDVQRGRVARTGRPFTAEQVRRMCLVGDDDHAQDSRAAGREDDRECAGP